MRVCKSNCGEKLCVFVGDLSDRTRVGFGLDAFFLGFGFLKKVAVVNFVPTDGTGRLRYIRNEGSLVVAVVLSFLGLPVLQVENMQNVLLFLIKKSIHKSTDVYLYVGVCPSLRHALGALSMALYATTIGRGGPLPAPLGQVGYCHIARVLGTTFTFWW